jgi:hypothetical protein
VEEMERTRGSILHAVANLEKKIGKAIEQEVETLYHSDVEKKETVTKKAKDSIQKGATKIKKTVEEHNVNPGTVYPYPFMDSHYPYEWPHGKSQTFFGCILNF